ncbi:MAG: hypothetical protein KBG09_05595 [Syntrophobacterales bacterium]|nr:hypothetical protein [Syntrophobacterales bacterium]
MTELDSRPQTCMGCGKPIGAVNGGEERREGEVYCPQCVIAQAERYIRPPEIETPRLQRLRETLAWKVSLAMIALVCLGFIAYQVPRIMAAFQEPKPVRMGTYATDAATDQCLKNIWRLAGDLQQGKKGMAPGVLCPASGKPYVIGGGANPEIHCPQPAAHGFRDIVASKRNPVPEMKK